MRSTWRRPLVGGTVVSSLIGLCCLFEPAVAWQFRELDSLDDSTLQVSPPDTAELVPTNEEFIAPIVNARDLSKKTEKPEADKKETDKPEAEKKDSVPKGEAGPGSGTTAVGAIKGPVNAVSAVKVEPELLDLAPVAGLPPIAAGTELEGLREAFSFDGPARQPAENLDRDVRVAVFREAQPGSTKSSELMRIWGEPDKRIDQDGATRTLLYRIPPFRQVDVVIRDDEVASVLVHLWEPVEVSDAASQLNLAAFAPVPIPDEFGEVLGQAYPERGLLFTFTDDLDTLNVSAILLEPISGETFRLRVQHDFDHQYERGLADLDAAIRIDPADAEAHWFKAELLDAVGRTRDAMKTAEEAIRLEPTNALYHISRARLLAKTKRHESAIAELRTALDEIDMPSEVAARAHCLLGNLLGIGPNPNHEEALEHHLKAIDFGVQVTTDRRFAIRRMAKHVLVDAHMAIARDIAMGNFQRQREVVPKWLLRATELADEFISDDNGDELLQLHVFRNTLACYNELQGNFDAVVANEEALRIGGELIAGANDELYKMQIERILAEILSHSGKIERSRGRYDAAMEYANQGLDLLKKTESRWQETSHDNYLRGQFYFLVGSLYAVQKSDHYEAVDWYRKADDIFADSDYVSPLYNDREHGEMHVSMGLSFWEVGEHEKAVRMTQLGADLMRKAVEGGALQVAALSVPYGNLATMHDKMGQNNKSQEFAKLVATVDEIVVEQKRR